MTTKQDISNTITAFHTNFKNDGFLVLDTNCAHQFSGQTLVNYKNLKIVKFQKTQLKQGDFDPLKFNNICHQRCKGLNPAQQLKQLYEQLMNEFPLCQVAVVSGDNYQACGELATYKKGDLSVYVY